VSSVGAGPGRPARRCDVIAGASMRTITVLYIGLHEASASGRGATSTGWEIGFKFAALARS